MKINYEHNAMRKELSRLIPGEKAIISKLTCTRELASRLMTMGIYEGNKVTLLRAAPFGGPLEVDVGYNVLIRKSEAKYVLVEKLEENLK